VARLTRNVEVVGRAPSKATVVSSRKKLYPYCLVLGRSMNGFEHNFTIELNKLRALWKIDFEGLSIPDYIHYIYFPILILEKEPVFSLSNDQC